MNNRKLLLVVSLILVLVVACAGPEKDSSEILVKFKPGTSADTMSEVHRQYGGRVTLVIPRIEVHVVEILASQVEHVLIAYNRNPHVEFAEINAPLDVAEVPDDTSFAQQWGMVKIQAPEAWDITHGSAGVNIAILDYGIDQDHPDVSSKITANANFTTSGTVDDLDGHGTHLAGIAGAVTGNNFGVAGVGYDSSLMNGKILRESVGGFSSWLANGMIWATDNGADVISISFITSGASGTLENAVNYAWDNGVVVVAAAGNNGNNTPQYPGAFANAIAVAATDSTDALAGFSSFGNWVNVAAPGVTIYSTLPGGTYGNRSGTSMAAPHVSGLVALLFAIAIDTNENGFVNDEVRSAIEATAEDIGVAGIGTGRINALLAVNSLSSTPATIGGNVTDVNTTLAIQGATVSDGTRNDITDVNGNYLIENVPAGTYTVTASAAGYQDGAQGVTVAAGDAFTADFALAASS